MRKVIVVLLGALGAVACGRERPPETAQTTTTRAGAPEPATVNPESVRSHLLDRKPEAAETINALMISKDDGVIVLRGRVEDEATHADIVNHVRAMPGVRAVRDELQIQPKRPTGRHDRPGTTTITGAETGGPQQNVPHGDRPGAHGQAPAGSKVEAVRESMKKAYVKPDPAMIDKITITEERDTVILRGSIPDEATRQVLLDAAKKTPGVKNVRDELKVEKRNETMKKHK
jgi:osmotically-inducible protein OsmY